MRRAFTLIEVVVAILISSLFGAVVFQVLNQAMRSVRTVDGVTASMFNVVGFYDRFERDVSGAFIPEMGDPERVMQAVLKQVKKQEALEQQKTDQQKQPQQGEKKQPPPPITLKQVQVKKVFVCETEGESVSRFTFITCNPLQVYGQSKPRIARIIYTLVDDARAPGTKKLLRQESPALGFEGGEKARTYLLLHNIKSLRLEFLAPVTAAQEEVDSDKKVNPQEVKKQKKEPKLQWYSHWPLVREKAKEGKRPEKIRDLPRAVRVHLQYRDPFDELLKSYEFVFTVHNYRAPTDLLGIQVMQELDEEKQEEQQPATGQGAGKPAKSQTGKQP